MASRLVFRYEDKGSMSTDLLYRPEDPLSLKKAIGECIRELIEKSQKLFPGRRVAKVEALMYDAKFIHRFRPEPITLNLEELNVRLGARPPAPAKEEPEEEEAA